MTAIEFIQLNILGWTLAGGFYIILSLYVDFPENMVGTILLIGVVLLFQLLGASILKGDKS